MCQVCARSVLVDFANKNCEYCANEKTFRDRGSGFVVMKAFIDWHKKYIEWWRKKLKISNYGIVWISFIKGLIIGLLIYHFFIK